MDFVTVVDQALALLRQWGRLTYRTLQRQFQLDDTALDDLKAQLLYAHPQVVDDAGRQSQADAARLFRVHPATVSRLLAAHRQQTAPAPPRPEDG